MKLDPNITQDIQNWLNTPEQERDIKAGADLMLSLNRNRALYNSIIRRPDKFLPKLVYELKKYLRMRLDNMAVADVVRMEQRVIPSVAGIIENPPVLSTDDELPAGHVALGRRPDHNSLPENIRELWESNEARYRQINVLFNELKAMRDSKPCDRYEKLVILDELDKTYRSNLEQYDNFRIDSADNAVPENIQTEAGQGNDNALNNARKTISKYRKQLAGLSPDDPQRPVALEKIQAAVNTVLSLEAGFADATREELITLGIKFE